MNNRLAYYPEITTKELEEALIRGKNQTDEAMRSLGEQFKSCVSQKGVYHGTGNTDWTEGFYTGELWLMYEMTGEERFKELALKQVHSFYERIQKRIAVEHHDMGFLYSLSCVAAYKLVGSQEGYEAALMAADHLLERFQEKGEFIQAWGPLGVKENYRLIIDCLLNLPLLYWASEVTGDNKYASVAKKHTHTCLKYVIREDHSTYHTYYFDPDTGLPIKGVTAQGNRNGSAWARGQAWGIYGLALSYRYTKEERYVELFKAVADFFIDQLPEDLVPYWDFDFKDDSHEPKDSSAAVIAICGMLEMSKYLEVEEAQYYTSVAKKMLKVLVDDYAVKEEDGSNGQLLHGTYAKKSPYNTVQDHGVDECTVWGDYYYLEAITRCLKDWKLYW